MFFTLSHFHFHYLCSCFFDRSLPLFIRSTHLLFKPHFVSQFWPRENNVWDTMARSQFVLGLHLHQKAFWDFPSGFSQLLQKHNNWIYWNIWSCLNLKVWTHTEVCLPQRAKLDVFQRHLDMLLLFSHLRILTSLLIMIIRHADAERVEISVWSKLLTPHSIIPSGFPISDLIPEHNRWYSKVTHCH